MGDRRKRQISKPEVGDGYAGLVENVFEQGQRWQLVAMNGDQNARTR